MATQDFKGTLTGTASGNLASGGALGTPSSGTLTNCTGLPAAGVSGTAATLGANTFTGTQKWAKGADVASAAALTLGADGNYFDITGTTSITSIGTVGIGTWVRLHFDGALTLTHHATDLILPSGANITTAAGDEAEFVEYASGDWRCVNYMRADGTALVGASSPVVLSAWTTNDTLTTTEMVGNVVATNTGAGGAVNLTLPAGAADLAVRVIVTVAQYLRITAAGSDKFRYGGSEGAAGGYIRSNVIGTSFTLIWSGGNWSIVDLVGILNYDE